MRYRITTHHHPGILDLAGRQIGKTLISIGFKDVKKVKLAETYELTCSPEQIEDVAKELTNQVMKFYTIETIKGE